jgi:hypothetical protein
MKKLFTPMWLLVAALVLVALPAAASAAGEALVTSGAPAYVAGPFPQNKQNEPSIAVNPVNPNIMVAGANEEIDLEACHPAVPDVRTARCPFTPGVGVSGDYISIDGGQTWKQPTYSGLTARDCFSFNDSSTTPCPHPGPIGTLPWYFENGLTSDGDPSVAFGPVKGTNGRFSYSNGTRLYYANLTSKLNVPRSEAAFRGFEAIYVSRTDHPEIAMNDEAGKRAWMDPVLATPRLSETTFSDKENIWADNAASSQFFGNAYICWTSFRANGQFRGASGNPEPIEVIRSTDGGDTWDQQQQISPADNTFVTGGRQGCTVRTDSNGVVYVFWSGTDVPTKTQVTFLSRSFDGGKTWEKQRPVATTQEVGVFDPNTGDFSFDGIGGARTDSFPSADIANGAPSGLDATNTIAMTFADARPGPQGSNETAMVLLSQDGGNTFTPISTPGQQAGDRPDFPAIAISPNGTTLYLTYDAFHAPWQADTAAPRPMEGVVRKATFAGAATSFATVHRGVTGDARGSSQNNLVAEFLGDYNYAVATRTFGAAVWNDVRFATDCPTIDAYRQAFSVYATGGGGPQSEDLPEIRSENGASIAEPAAAPTRPFAGPPVCPGTFGNTDIFSWVG